jgi:hypothetical protein
MKHPLAAVALGVAACASQAATLDTTDNSVAQAFQQGLTVETFESVPTRTPQTITDYTAGNAVSDTAFVFDEVAGVQFSVGGMVGVNRPALFDVDEVGAHAKSGVTVLGPVDFDGTTKFEHFIEVYFPTKVSKVGFWTNPALGPVQVLALNTNFAFSGETEDPAFEDITVDAGHFVGIERATAEIGGLKIFGFQGFTIDDFSFGAAAPIPEPGTYAMMALGLALLGLRRKARRA